MATCCDYRAMVASDKFTIGLNEAKFGLIAPFWFMDSFRNTVGTLPQTNFLSFCVQAYFFSSSSFRSERNRVCTLEWEVVFGVRSSQNWINWQNCSKSRRGCQWVQKRNHAATSMCSNVVRNNLKPIDYSRFERPIFFPGGTWPNYSYEKYSRKNSKPSALRIRRILSI